MKHKKAAALLCSALCLNAAFAVSFPKPVAAFDTANAILATVQVGAQYAYLNKQIHFLDNGGRKTLMKDIKKEYGVNKEPRANNMLKNVMTRLQNAIAKTDPEIRKKPYDYFVNNEESFNAFCTLGHNISVNIGLFKTLDYNEDEIAFVLAHEMGHGQKEHPKKGVRRGMPIALITALYQSQNPNVASVIGANVVRMSGTAKMVTMPMEKQADNLAFDYAVGAGYNVGAGAALWERILEENKGKSGSRLFGALFNDHPTNVKRRDNYSKKLTKWSRGKVKVDGKTGMIKIKGKDFIIPAGYGSMSSLERSYLVAGNLSAVFHNAKHPDEKIWIDRNSILYAGKQPIMQITTKENAGEIKNRLQKLLR